MADTYAMSFNTPNYSGMLFNKGNTRTPLSTLIGGRTKTTNHVEFVCGQYYTDGSATQPAISESASLTAPDATVVQRTQFTNVTQIFQETYAVSYAHEANMGTLSGVNIANQVANPMNERDFQRAVRMQKIANDIEYTFVNGAYNKANSDATINKTRGIVAAITTNAVAAGSAQLSVDMVTDALASIYTANAPTDGLVLLVSAVQARQLQQDAANKHMAIVPASRTMAGLALDTLATPLGNVYVRLGAFLPSGTAILINPSVMAPVLQPVPGKGVFFEEELAKVGAGTKYQLFGMVGLDHGPEWYHAKITGIATSFSEAYPTINTIAVSGS